MQNHLKEIREARGCTRAQLAAASGCPLDSIISWELGRRNLTDVYTCLRLCKLLCCTIEDLIEIPKEEDRP